MASVAHKPTTRSRSKSRTRQTSINQVYPQSKRRAGVASGKEAAGHGKRSRSALNDVTNRNGGAAVVAAAAAVGAKQKRKRKNATTTSELQQSSTTTTSSTSAVPPPPAASVAAAGAALQRQSSTTSKPSTRTRSGNKRPAAAAAATAAIATTQVPSLASVATAPASLSVTAGVGATAAPPPPPALATSAAPWYCAPNMVPAVTAAMHTTRAAPPPPAPSASAADSSGPAVMTRAMARRKRQSEGGEGPVASATSSSGSGVGVTESDELHEIDLSVPGLATAATADATAASLAPASSNDALPAADSDVDMAGEDDEEEEEDEEASESGSTDVSTASSSDASESRETSEGGPTSSGTAPVEAAAQQGTAAVVAAQGIVGSAALEYAVLPPGVTDIFANYQTQARYCFEYIPDIYRNLQNLEKRHNISTTYMADIQVDITAEMRAIMVDWLVEVAQEYRLAPCTLYVCVVYIDRCLQQITMSRSKLQLLGCACMLIAAKLEEVYTPSVDEFVYISDNTYTREQILQMESIILKRLDFRLAVATPWHFLKRFLMAGAAGANEILLTHYLCELTLQEYSFLKYKPSLVAAASVYLARLTLNIPGPTWTPNLEYYTTYTVADMRPCVTALHKLHGNARFNDLQAVREKYSHSPYQRVSRLGHHEGELFEAAVTAEAADDDATASSSASSSSSPSSSASTASGASAAGASGRRTSGRSRRRSSRS